jgi:hypothetical protein
LFEQEISTMAKLWIKATSETTRLQQEAVLDCEATRSWIARQQEAVLTSSTRCDPGETSREEVIQDTLLIKKDSLLSATR